MSSGINIILLHTILKKLGYEVKQSSHAFFGNELSKKQFVDFLIASLEQAGSRVHQTKRRVSEVGYSLCFRI